jgi:hypothetical protein
MQNLLKQYGVTDVFALIEAIRDEYARETDERPDIYTAQVILDQMLDAEYQRIEGGAYDGR